MAAVSSLTSSTPQEARERLLASLHDAGIEPSSPLGLIMMSQSEGISQARARFDRAAEALFAASLLTKPSERTKKAARRPLEMSQRGAVLRQPCHDRADSESHANGQKGSRNQDHQHTLD